MEEDASYDELRKRLVTIWEDFYEEMEEYMEDLEKQNADIHEEMYGQWSEYTDKILEQQENIDSLESYASMTEMFNNWVKISRNFREMVEENTEGDLPPGFQDIYSDYMDNIRNVLTKAINLTMEKQRKEQENLYDLWIDAWSQMANEEEVPEAFKMFQENWMESTPNLFEIWQDSLQEGKTEDLFKKSQREMIKSASEAMQDLISSEPYAQLQGSYIDNVLDTKITQQELMSTYLESMNLPTRDDMLKIYESIHELTSRIREVERRLDELPIEE
ncbi:MAG: poly(R)-hydroxyalkanoic acid synthase subunit PhaE [Candidatus Thermoplasmatota archaeon]